MANEVIDLSYERFVRTLIAKISNKACSQPFGSPIEELLFWDLCYAAVEEDWNLAVQTHEGNSFYENELLYIRDKSKPLLYLPRVGEGKRNILRIFRQVDVGKYRADFIVQSQNNDLYKNLVVECDGHDWHDRTKEQASHDRKRDRYLQFIGLPVFRFTGSDLYKDSVGCAQEVLSFLKDLRGQKSTGEKADAQSGSEERGDVRVFFSTGPGPRPTMPPPPQVGPPPPQLGPPPPPPIIKAPEPLISQAEVCQSDDGNNGDSTQSNSKESNQERKSNRKKK